MLNPALIDKIDKYLLGQMAEEEKEVFLHQLAESPNEQEVFELLKNIGPAYQRQRVQALRQKMSSWDQEPQKNQVLPKVEGEKAATTITGKKRLNWLAAAAIGMLLLGAGLYFGKGIGHMDYAQLYQEHYKLYPYAKVRRAAPIELTEPAYQLYNAEKYDEAIAALNKIESNQAQFFLGQAQMAQKNYEAAIEHFTTYLGKEDALQSQAKWYLALSHLALNQKIKSLEILDGLATEKSAYGIKAENLIAQMK